jgi:hypothetical protein
MSGNPDAVSYNGVRRTSFFNLAERDARQLELLPDAAW